MPTYYINGKNVLGIGAFKRHFCLWFHQGVFLKDEHNLLINAQENKTKALRQMQFESVDEINDKLVLSYINEAIENQKAGKEIKPQRKSKPVIIPKELNKVLNKNKELRKMFYTLSLSCQRDYCQHIAEAKRENTKLKRLEKIIPMIVNGDGLNDKYK